MGMWEPQQPIYKHICKKESKEQGCYWTCSQYNRPNEPLNLTMGIPQCCHDDEYQIEVASCPFCGYVPKPIP